MKTSATKSKEPNEAAPKQSKLEACNVHAGHEHQHGEGCGHTMVRHGDHVDYMHDGRLHRVHGKHFDECKGPVTPEKRTK